MQLNFDQTQLLDGLNGVARRLISNPDDLQLDIPRLLPEHQPVVHDRAFGDGGVRRVHLIAQEMAEDGQIDHPLVQAEVRADSPPWMLIPLGGDPYADDLVRDYWFAVRSHVATALTR